MDDNKAKAILADARKARSDIGDLDLAIDAEVNEIVLRAAQENRPLSDEDNKRRDKLRADQKKLGKAFTELGFVTLERLNKSTDVENLKHNLTAINADLTADLNRLKAIARFAEAAAKVTDGLAKLAEKFAGVLV